MEEEDERADGLAALEMSIGLTRWLVEHTGARRVDPGTCSRRPKLERRLRRCLARWRDGELLLAFLAIWSRAARLRILRRSGAARRLQSVARAAQRAASLDAAAAAADDQSSARRVLRRLGAVREARLQARCASAAAVAVSQRDAVARWGVHVSRASAVRCALERWLAAWSRTALATALSAFGSHACETHVVFEQRISADRAWAAAGQRRLSVASTLLCEHARLHTASRANTAASLLHRRCRLLRRGFTQLDDHALYGSSIARASAALREVRTVRALGRRTQEWRVAAATSLAFQRLLSLGRRTAAASATARFFGEWAASTRSLSTAAAHAARADAFSRERSVANKLARWRLRHPPPRALRRSSVHSPTHSSLHSSTHSGGVNGAPSSWEARALSWLLTAVGGAPLSVVSGGVTSDEGANRTSPLPSPPLRGPALHQLASRRALGAVMRKWSGGGGGGSGRAAVAAYSFSPSLGAPHGFSQPEPVSATAAATASVTVGATVQAASNGRLLPADRSVSHLRFSFRQWHSYCRDVSHLRSITAALSTTVYASRQAAALATWLLLSRRHTRLRSTAAALSSTLLCSRQAAALSTWSFRCRNNTHLQSTAAALSSTLLCSRQAVAFSGWSLRCRDNTHRNAVAATAAASPRRHWRALVASIAYWRLHTAALAAAARDAARLYSLAVRSRRRRQLRSAVGAFRVDLARARARELFRFRRAFAAAQTNPQATPDSRAAAILVTAAAVSDATRRASALTLRSLWRGTQRSVFRAWRAAAVSAAAERGDAEAAAARAALARWHGAVWRANSARVAAHRRRLQLVLR